MQASVRVFMNTGALYVKLFITTIIQLYLIRVVLNTLGVEDFGIYTITAGVIAMLSFLNSALMSSTQRYLSVTMGSADKEMLKIVFSVSFFLHLLLAIFLIIILEICGLFLFDGFLNIPENRIGVGKIIYHVMIISVFFTIIGAPYNAVINAHEDLWFFSIVEIVGALLKLALVVGFKVIHYDALLLYAIWMMAVTIIVYIIKYIWCRIRYLEIKLNVHGILGNKALIKELSSFTGWNTLGSLARTGRNQGVTITLNVFFGTAINAVFGIANQVASSLLYFSQMMTTSMAPQIAKSKGTADTGRMRYLSILTSKVAFLLSAIIAIPLLIELDDVLKIWLKEVPEYTYLYCQIIILLFLVTQLYPGLVRGIQANGNIKWYQILVSVLLLIPIPIGIILFSFNYPHYYILYAMLVAQVLTFIVTVYMAHQLIGIDIKSYGIFTAKSILLVIITYLIGNFIHINVSSTIPRLCLVVLFTTFVFSLLYVLLVLDKKEKATVINMFHSILNKLKK